MRDEKEKLKIIERKNPFVRFDLPRIKYKIWETFITNMKKIKIIVKENSPDTKFISKDEKEFECNVQFLPSLTTNKKNIPFRHRVISFFRSSFDQNEYPLHTHTVQCKCRWPQSTHITFFSSTDKNQ